MRGLGELEAVVMARLWAQETPATVRQVADGLRPERPLAYTTVLTVMDNLHRKGFLAREQTGRAYRYWPAQSQSGYAAELMGEALGDSGDRDGALLKFVQEMTPAEVAALRHALTTEQPDRPRRRRR